MAAETKKHKFITENCCCSSLFPSEHVTAGANWVLCVDVCVCVSPAARSARPSYNSPGSPAGLITGKAVSVTGCCHLQARKRAANWLLFGFKYRARRAGSEWKNAVWIIERPGRAWKKTGTKCLVGMIMNISHGTGACGLLVIVYLWAGPVVLREKVKNVGRRSSFIRWKGIRRRYKPVLRTWGPQMALVGM